VTVDWHNLLGYDWPVLVDLLVYEFPTYIEISIDTLIISKLVDYPRQGHSVEDYGLEFGLEKVSIVTGLNTLWIWSLTASEMWILPKEYIGSTKNITKARTAKLVYV